MPRRREAPHEDDDAALEARWGREASARAAPVERPAPPSAGPGPGGRPWRLGLVAGGAVVVVVVTAVLVAVGRGEDGERVTRRPAPPSTVAPSTTVPAWEPAWATSVACPRFEVTPELRTTACPVAADDERVYVIEELDDGATPADDPVPSLVAMAVSDGRAEWAVPFPGGASTVVRYPSTLVVVGSQETHSVEPATGRVRWSLPGVPLAPLGREHLLLDHVTEDGAGSVATMSVVDATTGVPTFARSGPAPALYVHPCGEAGLVIVSEPGRWTAHGVVDGEPRWSVEAPHHDGFAPLVCSPDALVEVQAPDVLVTRDVRTGAANGTAEVLPPGDQGLAPVVEVVGGTIVVASSARVEGFAATPGLVRRWTFEVGSGGRDAVVGPAATGVGVAVPGNRAGWFGPGGAPGPQLLFQGHDDVVIDGDRLVAWGAEEVLVASAVELTRARRLPLPDVRRAAAAPTHVVVTTRDEVRLYPFDP